MVPYSVVILHHDFHSFYIDLQYAGWGWIELHCHSSVGGNLEQVTNTLVL